MRVIDFLKDENGARVLSGDKWLVIAENVVNGDTIFRVYQRKYGAKKTVILIETTDEHEAVKVLSGESCVQCGKPENNSHHSRYGADLNNPLKHEFERNTK